MVAKGIMSFKIVLVRGIVSRGSRMDRFYFDFYNLYKCMEWTVFILYL